MRRKGEETEKETAECIGEVEVAAVPPDVKDLDVPADSSKKSLPEKDEKGKDKAAEGSEKPAEEEKQKEYRKNLKRKRKAEPEPEEMVQLSFFPAL